MAIWFFLLILLVVGIVIGGVVGGIARQNKAEKKALEEMMREERDSSPANNFGPGTVITGEDNPKMRD